MYLLLTFFNSSPQKTNLYGNLPVSYVDMCQKGYKTMYFI